VKLGKIQEIKNSFWMKRWYRHVSKACSKPKPEYGKKLSILTRR